MTDYQNTDFAKICAQLQIQRNQFADAHATAAARAEALAEELERVKDERNSLRADIQRQSNTIHNLSLKISDLEKPKPEMPPVTRDDETYDEYADYDND